MNNFNHQHTLLRTQNARQAPRNPLARETFETLQAYEQTGLIKFPVSKAEKKSLQLHLEKASDQEPITLFAGSCPDYSHTAGKYDHKQLNGGIPLLSQVHIEYDLPLLKIIEEARIPYKYLLMVADVEAIDEVFCDTYTGGNIDQFLELCKNSQEQTAEVLAAAKSANGLTGELVSSSFFETFGQEVFMHYQNAYHTLIASYFDSESAQAKSACRRVMSDTFSRGNLYNKVYKTVLPKMNSTEQTDFLVGRTIRTMAQYLTLGRLMRNQAEFPALINHPTTNSGLYNDLNKYILEEDSPHSVPAMPVFEITQAVY